ncbi:DUF3592 domain-containing protein [Streptomyces sp. NPDC006512]|uniref:DUF3592 domain-containing protein n=1 Tax=Streptomyces sp. NPDC006512 TaxID=3154307 RepID=UPI0033BD701C
MPITSPIPVLQGSKKTVLRSVGGALLLSRPHEELSIPLAAIERVRAAGRSVAVELTAAVGATPAVHRVGGVSEAAARAFADAVNRALPERAEGDVVVDGSGLVVTRVLTESQAERRRRAFRWGALAVALVLVAVALAFGIRVGGIDGFMLAVATLLGGLFSAVGIAGGAAGLWSACRGWYLTRRGITVEAENAAETPGELRGSGTYIYTDTAGVSRSMALGRTGAETIQVAYDPQDPARVVTHRSGRRTAVYVLLSLVCLCFGLGFTFALIMMLITA